jgi:ParB family transcriptional regulator, chromosome partitioning protein
MARHSKAGDLEYLPIDKIDRNAENPRLVFRSNELVELADSILKNGVQVPISVYRDGQRFTIIDGERRWRASKMINADQIPAIIYPKPSPIQNLVFMFNIHRFRRDWDPLPTAMKLEELDELIRQQRGQPPTEAELAALTGMSRGAVRRCKLIMELPSQDRRRILKELNKPEHEQRITTDLFIECQRSVRTVGTYLPALTHLEEPLRHALINKYERQTIKSVTEMRRVARIARAASKGATEQTVERILQRLIREVDLGVEEAYQGVAWVYDIRSITNQAQSLHELLRSLDADRRPLDSETIKTLQSLAKQLRSLLGHRADA